MFRSEPTDTRMGSGSASCIEDRTLCDGVSIRCWVTPLSVRSLSKIAHFYDRFMTGVIGNQTRNQQVPCCVPAPAFPHGGLADTFRTPPSIFSRAPHISVRTDDTPRKTVFKPESYSSSTGMPRLPTRKTSPRSWHHCATVNGWCTNAHSADPNRCCAIWRATPTRVAISNSD